MSDGWWAAFDLARIVAAVTLIALWFVEHPPRFVVAALLIFVAVGLLLNLKHFGRLL